MEIFYPLLVSFSLIFLSELGDKTQIMILSFSAKNKMKNILLGIALGTFLSHGLAILFGSRLGSVENEYVSYYLNVFTYISFILFGIWGFVSMNRQSSDNKENHKTGIISKLSKLKINFVFIIAFCIFIGELGDKTFLSSIGLGIQYPEYKISLILGSILGMVCSNLLAIIFGKLLSMKFHQNMIEIISNSLFIIFGIIGLIFNV